MCLPVASSVLPPPPPPLLPSLSLSRARSLAYIEFKDKDAVANALILSGTEFMGRPLKVVAKRTNVPQFQLRGRGRGGPVRGGGFRGRGGGSGIGGGYRGRGGGGYRGGGGGGYRGGGGFRGGGGYRGRGASVWRGGGGGGE